MKILVVDDDPIVRTVTSTILEDAGYQVACAEGGVEALETIKREPPACILLDLYMDDKSGFDVLLEIREILDKQICPIVMVSSENDKESVGVALEFGANDFLFKPVSGDVLREKLTKLLGPLPSAKVTLEPEHRLGRYRITRFLREVGEGSLYAAQDERLGRQVCVKVSPTAEREAAALARVSDGRVIAVYDFEALPFPYLVTELIDGEPLSTLTRRPKLSEALRWTCEALLGLRALHAQGLIHTRVETTTVNLTRAGRIYLSELGGAMLTRGLPLPGSRQVPATPSPYEAPELRKDDPAALTSSADLYSATALMVFLVTGSNERHELPPPLISVAERGLSEDPADRFQAAGELVQALAGILKSL